MDSRYGIHTIELFHRLSRKDFNKVFHSLKSLNSGSFYSDTTYHSDKGMAKYICTSYCGQGVVLYLYQQVRSQNKTKKILHLLFIFVLIPHFAARRIFPQESIQIERESAKIA